MAATGGHGTEKGVHELSCKGDVERTVMDTSHSKLGESLCMFWKRPLVYKWGVGSRKAQRKMSPGMEEAKTLGLPCSSPRCQSVDKGQPL